jgi:hypothetical protein
MFLHVEPEKLVQVGKGFPPRGQRGRSSPAAQNRHPTTSVKFTPSVFKSPGLAPNRATHDVGARGLRGPPGWCSSAVPVLPLVVPYVFFGRPAGRANNSNTARTRARASGDRRPRATMVGHLGWQRQMQPMTPCDPPARARLNVFQSRARREAAGPCAGGTGAKTRRGAHRDLRKGA